MNEAVLKVCKNFSRQKINEIQALGNGLINDTFLVSTEQQKFVLQRINSEVFPQPGLIMDNLLLLNQHLDSKPATSGDLSIPRLVRSLNNKTFHQDDDGHYWRTLEFINDTLSKETIDDKDDAYNVGLALGNFHALLNDVDFELFHDTLPGFHIAPEYFKNFQTALKNNTIDDSAEFEFCKQFIADSADKISILEDAKQQGILKNRIIHGDPKLNNFLFDKNTRQIVSLIDLDTVKPGLIHYDIADCLRSCCHEKTGNRFDFELCQVILKGYIEQTGEFLTQQDYQYLYPAIELMPLELGVRFLTDYLQGNRYFKVSYDGENLERAINQFQLSKSIAKQKIDIEKLIFKFKQH